MWRCCTRVSGRPSACDSPTIKEEVLQDTVMKAINRMLGEKSRVIEDLKEIAKKRIRSELDEKLDKIDEKLEVLQKELATKAMAKMDYEEVLDEVTRIKEEKQRIFVEQAEDKGRQVMREQLAEFLEAQSAEVKGYDEGW